MVYKNYFNLPLITYKYDDHGVVIVQLDLDVIFLEEGGFGFLVLWLEII